MAKITCICTQVCFVSTNICTLITRNIFTQLCFNIKYLALYATLFQSMNTVLCTYTSV